MATGTTIGEHALVMHGADVVATAIADLEPGTVLSYDGREVTVSETVRFGHKLALESMRPGDPVIKYGEVIGTSTASIDVGEWVHTHNVRSNRGGGEADA